MKKDTVQLYKLNCFFKNGGMIENRVFNSLLDLKNIQVYKSILFKNCMFSKTILLSNTQLLEMMKIIRHAPKLTKISNLQTVFFMVKPRLTDYYV